MAQAQVVFDQSQSADTATSVVSSLTFSATVANNPNRVLVVGCAAVVTGATNVDVTTVTFNGDSMLQAGEISNENGVQHPVASLWYLVAPDVATGNVVASVSPDARMACGTVSLYGVDQSTPISGVQTDDGGDTTATSIDVVVTSEAGDMVVDVAAKRFGADALSVGASQTQRWNDESTGATDANNITGGGSTEPGAASVTMSWSSGSSRHFAQVGMNINAAVAAQQQHGVPLWFH